MSDIDLMPRLIEEECEKIKSILLEKNRLYGNSVLNPLKIFSQLSAMDQIDVRIDDKLKRIVEKKMDDTEDTVTDLIGYLILRNVVEKVLDIKRIKLLETIIKEE